MTAGQDLAHSRVHLSVILILVLAALEIIVLSYFPAFHRSQYFQSREHRFADRSCTKSA